MHNKADVWEAVEKFRREFPKQLCDIPADVLTVIEIEMGLDVVPLQNLQSHYLVDAAVIPDFSGIYVDKYSYRYIEGRPVREFNRLRFSIAHELGHIVLHRHLAPQKGFASIQEFFEWTRQYQKDKYTLEQQANEFAGRLLVSVNRLTEHFDEFSNRAKSKNVDMSDPAIRDRLSCTPRSF